MKKILKIAFTCTLLTFTTNTNAEAANKSVSTQIAIVDTGGGGGKNSFEGDYSYNPCSSYSKSCLV